MCLRACDHHVEPPLTQRTCYNANGFIVGFKDRALLNVRFEIGGDALGSGVVFVTVSIDYEGA